MSGFCFLPVKILQQSHTRKETWLNFQMWSVDEILETNYLRACTALASAFNEVES